MTGILHAIAGSGPGTIVSNPTPWSISYSAASGAGNTAGAQISFVESGQVGSAGNGTPTITQGTNWFSPPSQPTGTLKYWVRATLSAGTAPDTGTLGTWIAILGSVVFGWAGFTTVGSKTCTLKIEIADSAAGTNIVFTTTGNVIAASHA